jgi:hypothetical protein
MEWIALILFLTTGFFAYLSWRLWQENNLYENAITGLNGYMNLLHQMCAQVLEKDIYSADPLVRAFVDVLNDIEPYIIKFGEEYGYTSDIPPEPKEIEGFKDDHVPEEDNG